MRKNGDVGRGGWEGRKGKQGKGPSGLYKGEGTVWDRREEGIGGVES